jgi:heme/copper-type cytochrome/quinol oxidase subunit 3
MSDASDVTRSMEATGAVAASYAERRRRARPSGWWGVSLLICTEAALFGTVIASYFYLQAQVPAWPPPGVDKPIVTWPLVLTGVLLATSVPLFLAARAAKRGRTRATWLLLALALLVQCGYIAGQALLFVDDYHKSHPTENAYTSIYFTLVGAHGAHVAVGMALIGFLLVRLAWGLTNYRVIAVRVVTLYWLFVNVIAIPVVLTQVSPSL